MKLGYSVAIILGCIAIHLIDASISTTLSIQQRWRHNLLPNLQEKLVSRQLLRQKVFTVTSNNLEIYTLLYQLNDWTESFLFLIPSTRPETLSTRLIHLVTDTLKNTREMIMQHTQDDDPFIDIWFKRINQQLNTNISDLLIEQNQRLLHFSKRRIASQREDGEEGDEQHHSKDRHGDDNDNDEENNHRNNQDRQDSDKHRESKGDEEGEREDGKEGDEKHRVSHDIAKMKRQLSSPLLVKEVYIALEKVNDYAYLMPYQGDLFLHLTHFKALIHQVIDGLDFTIL